MPCSGTHKGCHRLQHTVSVCPWNLYHCGRGQFASGVSCYRVVSQVAPNGWDRTLCHQFQACSPVTRCIESTHGCYSVSHGSAHRTLPVHKGQSSSKVVLPLRVHNGFLLLASTRSVSTAVHRKQPRMLHRVLFVGTGRPTHGFTCKATDAVVR